MRNAFLTRCCHIPPVEHYFLWGSIALCIFSLWAIARHDWLRLTRPSRLVLARVTGQRSSTSDGSINYAPIFRFTAEGTEHEVIDAVYGARPKPPVGTVIELSHPVGHPQLARPPRLLMWLSVYAFLLFMLAILLAKLLGWLD